MSDAADTYPSLSSALSARFRGHTERNWKEWHARHYFPTAAAIPEAADKVLLGREESLARIEDCLGAARA